MSDLKNDLKNVPYIKQFFGEYLDLRKDKDNEALIVESIRNGVEFKGTNLWILIFAIFIASLGLNVNSTAVALLVTEEEDPTCLLSQTIVTQLMVWRIRPWKKSTL